jgi:hypothetical protein
MKKEYIIAFETEGLGGVKQIVPIKTTKAYPSQESAEIDAQRLITIEPTYVLYVLPRYSKA